MERRRYSPEQKAKALALYAEHGAAEAARQTGIPEGTLQSWAHRTGTATACNEQRQANVDALKAKWDERRQQMIHEIGAVAHLALARTQVAVEAGNGRTAKEFATTMAILVDKAQLLSGAATSRTETTTRDHLDREIEHLLESAPA